MLKKKLLRFVVCCVKLQKRINVDFYKTQYFFFFQKISEENNFCENVEKKTFEVCCVLCKTAETR